MPSRARPPMRFRPDAGAAGSRAASGRRSAAGGTREAGDRIFRGVRKCREDDPSGWVSTPIWSSAESGGSTSAGDRSCFRWRLLIGYAWVRNFWGS